MAKDVQIIPAKTHIKQKAVNTKVGTELELTPEQLAQIDKVIRKSEKEVDVTLERRRGNEPFDGNEKRSS